MPHDTTSREPNGVETPVDGEADTLTPSPPDAPSADRADKSQSSTNRNVTPLEHVKAADKQGSSKKMSSGHELEVRLARMHYWKGAYARRGVNLQRHFDPEPLVVTDLDLLAVDITSQLTFAKTIGEAKSGTGRSAPKPLDRAIWIAGLKQLVGASSGVIVTATKASPQVRDTARSLGVISYTVDDLDRWERTHLPPVLADVGSRARAPSTLTTQHAQWQRASRP